MKKWDNNWRKNLPVMALRPLKQVLKKDVLPSFTEMSFASNSTRGCVRALSVILCLPSIIANMCV